MEILDLIYQHIVDGEIPSAIQALKKVIEEGELESELLQNEARFNQNEKQNRLGILSSEAYAQEKNKINKALIDIYLKSKKATQNSTSRPSGFCIRTGREIPFDLEKPFTKEAYRIWVKYMDEEYPEKYCHFTGEASHGETTFKKPVLKKNWKKAQKVHGI